MKAREWIRYLDRQQRVHDKRLFTITELANAARTSNPGFHVELSRLRKYGIIQRYARGIYGLPGLESPELLLPELDPRAYITGGSGLYHHNLISQVSVQVTVFTDRRHGRSRFRRTPLGTFRFVCVAPPVYRRPREGVFASAEQALLDYYYLCRREGGWPISQVSFRGLDRLSPAALERLAARYPATVIRQIRDELGDFIHGLPHRERRASPPAATSPKR